jgi:alpha-L-arabinofuranosidase
MSRDSGRRYATHKTFLPESEALTTSALGWVEYCNSSADTHYANLRRQNGREDPYNVSLISYL